MSYHVFRQMMKSELWNQVSVSVSLTIETKKKIKTELMT